MPLSRWILLISNYAIFYGLWFLAIWSALHHMSWIALLSTAVYITAHLSYWSHAPRQEAIFIAVLTGMGVASDVMFSLMDIVTYHDAIAPGLTLWTLSLWICFATTYWHSFIWLEGKPILAGILGAIAAPLCYNSLVHTEVIAWNQEAATAQLWVGAFWALFLPISFAISSSWRTKVDACL